MSELPAGCGYQGYEFGAGYPDSECFGGRLYDMDNCDDAGLYEPLDYVPCPMCDRRGAVAYHKQRNLLSITLSKRRAARRAIMLVYDIRRNRKNGTEPWKHKEEQPNGE